MIQYDGLSKLYNSLNELPGTDKMPVLFIGHGNPMNAIEKNIFSEEWKKIADNIPSPKAILCVSAHWLTNGIYVATTEKPKTIHDFYGFPEKLFQTEYKAPGAPFYAKETEQLLSSENIKQDTEWGLDHGAWSVLLPMYPNADIPVFQLSIDINKPASYHYKIGNMLQSLRHKGVLILGSGNIVHNLGKIIWEDKAFDWAEEFDLIIAKHISDRNDKAITDYEKLGKIAQLAVPTPDHFYPLLYALGATQEKEPIRFFTEKNTFGSISMRSMQIG